MDNQKWSENVILVDADYVDGVAFDLTVNFERMLERRIPKADLARWLDCVALDGGVREGDNAVQVVLIHRGEQLENFVPAVYNGELDGMAFSDRLGEFSISCVKVEPMVTAEELFLDSLGIICTSHDVRRVMVVPNAEQSYAHVRETLHRLDDAADGKRITVFTMQPQQGGPFRQEILGYSLMAALGIKAEEIK